MGEKVDECTPCCEFLGVRVLAVLSAVAIAGALTVAISTGTEVVARHAAHTHMELPHLAQLLIGWFISRADAGVHLNPCAALLTLAALMLPYFLACACVPRAQRGTPGGIAFRLAVHVAWCGAVGLFAALALALPFACL
jgi:hypothetical protein